MRQDKFADQMLPLGSAPTPPSRHGGHLQRHGVHGLAKASLDRTVAAVALVLLAPVLLVVALCVSATSPGPVFVRRQRIGRDGRLFSLLGFRTTETDAAGGHAPEDRHVGWPEFDVEPAETPLGAILRRFSIDELPQLFNVLRGDMSLVGPRPACPYEVAGLGGDVHRHFPVKPGLTGLGWSSGPDRFPGDGRPVDAAYVENWSLSLDLIILRRAFAAALRGNGTP